MVAHMTADDHDQIWDLVEAGESYASRRDPCLSGWSETPVVADYLTRLLADRLDEHGDDALVGDEFGVAPGWSASCWGSLWGDFEGCAR